MALPPSVAVDKPLVLGSTMLDAAGEAGYYTLKLDFQPESFQQAEHADLLLLGEGQLKLVPLLPDGDTAACYFDGSLEQLQQRPSGDVECVAYFDGTEWTLELVQAHLRAKHRPGVPVIPGYNVDVPEDVYDAGTIAAADEQANLAAVQQQLGAASMQAQQHGHPAAAAVEHEIDPDLDDALEEALFAAEKPSQQAQHTEPDQQVLPAAAAAVAAPPAVRQPPAAAEVHLQQPSQQQPRQQTHHVFQTHSQQQQQQQQQPQQQPQPPQPAALAQVQPQQQLQPPVQAAAADADDDDDSAEESDDPWNTFDAAAAPAPAPKAAIPPVPLHPPHRHVAAAVSAGAASITPQHSAPPPPAAAVAAHPAAAAAGPGAEARGPVSVLGGEEEEEEEAGPGVQECSEDESDGVGVEYF